MEIKTTLLAATNRLSRYSVVVVEAQNDRSGVASDLAQRAVNVQAMIGAPGMKVIQAGLTGNQAGFECITPKLGRDLLRYVRVLARSMDDIADNSEKSHELSSQVSRLWKNAVSHHAALAAVRLGIPWEVETRHSSPLISLGHGVHRRLFWRSFTPDTAEVGVVFSTPKNIVGQLLYNAGLPVPAQALAADFDAAERLAEKIGWPVVVKPARTDHGVAITTNIGDKNELRAAFGIANAHGDVLIQKHIVGEGHRLLVHNGKCIAAVRQKAAQVVGDGHSSVSVLIAKTNETRTENLSRNWKKIVINDVLMQMLDRAGLTLESIPAKGQIVLLRGNTNLSQGGTCERVMDDVHPENLAIAEAAAAVFGLDFAGVDVHTTDISVPLLENGGAVIEVNSTPAWFMLEEGTSLEDKIVSHFFPAPARGRIPIVVCLEEHPKKAISVAEAFSKLLVVAVSTSDGVSVGGHSLAVDENASVERRTQVALSHPHTQMVVISVPELDLLQHGLGVDRISLAVGERGSNKDALRCLCRSSKATVVFAEDIRGFLVDEQNGSELWCVTEDIKRNPLKDETAVVPVGQGRLQVKPADGPIREFQNMQLDSSEPIALQVIALLCEKALI